MIDRGKIVVNDRHPVRSAYLFSRHLQRPHPVTGVLTLAPPAPPSEALIPIDLKTDIEDTLIFDFVSSHASTFHYLKHFCTGRRAPSSPARPLTSLPVSTRPNSNTDTFHHLSVQRFRYTLIHISCANAGRGEAPRAPLR